MTNTLIDRKLIEDFTANDPNLLADLSVLFVRFLPGSLASMNLAIENGDAEMLRETAHQLKGQLGYFFCELLVEQTSQLEELARTEQMQNASTIAMNVSKNIHRLLDELRALTNLDLNLEED